MAETPSLRKKCNKFRGTAGPRRARILKEIARDKKKSTSKIGFVDEPVPPVPDPVPAKNGRDKSPPPRVRPDGWVVPSPNCGISSEDEDEDKDEDTRADPARPARGIKPAAGCSASSSASQPIPESSDKEV